MEKKIGYQFVKDLVDKMGWNGFVNYFEEQYGFDFYTCSKDWYKNKEYVCKLKGAKGDLLLIFES